MVSLIGIAGQHDNGKNKIADYLLSKLKNWKVVGFADAVKKVFCETFNVSLEFVEEWKRKNECPPGFSKTIRQSLQFIGDGFRQLQENVWINIAFRDKVPKIICDVRYFNELRRIKNEGGINILVWRDGYKNNDSSPSEAQVGKLVDFCLNENIDGAVVEWRTSDFGYCDLGDQEILREISLIDYFIRNDGTLEDLYKKIDNLILKEK